jgi:hypothetical protein
MDQSDLLKAIVGFVVLEVVLRQAMDRMSSIATMRISALSKNYRPALRFVRQLHKDKRFPRKNIERLIQLVESIEPLPPRDCMDSLKQFELNSNIQHLEKLEEQLRKHIENERAYVISFISPFGQLQSAYSFSFILGIVFFSLRFSWVPCLVLWWIGLISKWYLFSAILIFIVDEIFLRKGTKPKFF